MPHELYAAIIIFIGFQIPWSHPVLFSISVLLGMFGLLYFCASLVDRLYIKDKTGHRANLDKPEEDMAQPPYQPRELRKPRERPKRRERRKVNYGRPGNDSSGNIDGGGGGGGSGGGE